MHSEHPSHDSDCIGMLREGTCICTLGCWCCTANEPCPFGPWKSSVTMCIDSIDSSTVGLTTLLVNYLSLTGDFEKVEKPCMPVYVVFNLILRPLSSLC